MQCVGPIQSTRPYNHGVYHAGTNRIVFTPGEQVTISLCISVWNYSSRHGCVYMSCVWMSMCTSGPIHQLALPPTSHGTLSGLLGKWYSLYDDANAHEHIPYLPSFQLVSRLLSLVMCISISWSQDQNQRVSLRGPVGDRLFYVISVYIYVFLSIIYVYLSIICLSSTSCLCLSSMSCLSGRRSVCILHGEPYLQ